MKSVKKIQQQREHSRLKKERRILNIGYSLLSSAEHKRRAYEKEQEKERKKFYALPVKSG